VAQKLLDIFPIGIDGGGERRLEVSASIGISLYPEDGRTVEALVDAADQAMYRAKRSDMHIAAAAPKGAAAGHPRS
jgi:diguanylate cyclase (GGDEF)-like protein